MNKILSQRNTVALRLKKDVEMLWDTIHEIGYAKYISSNSRFIWKPISDGYGCKVRIFIVTKRRFFNKQETLVYDIEDESCFKKLIDSQDMRIFEAIEDATNWISGETEKIQLNVNSFYGRYIENKTDVKRTIESYNMLKERT